LYLDELPFSKRSQEIVKDIMLVDNTLGLVLRAKTGRSEQGGKQIGWHVGYLERKKDVYFFSNCIQSSDSLIPDFAGARAVITYKILSDLRLTEK
jgi:beta-lactamase class D